MDIRKARIEEAKDIVKFIDFSFAKEGYGFVTSAQINTEVKKGSVWVATILLGEQEIIVGTRIGLNKVYNLAVHPLFREKGIGRKLIEIYPPEIIRVKANPIGHLSKKQIENFKTPVGFYQKIGYFFGFLDYARNFWQRGKGKEAHFHKMGKNKHIQVWIREPQTESDYVISSDPATP